MPAWTCLPHDKGTLKNLFGMQDSPVADALTRVVLGGVSSTSYSEIKRVLLPFNSWQRGEVRAATVRKGADRAWRLG